MQSPSQFSRTLWSKDKDLWSEDKNLQIGPWGSSRTRTFLEDNNTAHYHHVTPDWKRPPGRQHHCLAGPAVTWCPLDDVPKLAVSRAWVRWRLTRGTMHHSTASSVLPIKWFEARSWQVGCYSWCVKALKAKTGLHYDENKWKYCKSLNTSQAFNTGWAFNTSSISVLIVPSIKNWLYLTCDQKLHMWKQKEMMEKLKNRRAVENPWRQSRPQIQARFQKLPQLVSLLSKHLCMRMRMRIFNVQSKTDRKSF